MKKNPANIEDDDDFIDENLGKLNILPISSEFLEYLFWNVK